MHNFKASEKKRNKRTKYLQSRESLDVQLGINIVGSGIDLGDNDTIVRSKVGSDLLVNRSEGLAVAAPRSIELQKNVFAGVKHNFVIVLGNNDSDGSLVKKTDDKRPIEKTRRILHRDIFTDLI